MLHDKTLDLHIMFSNPQLYHLIHECGVLETERFTIKAIFCNASFKQNGTILCIYTDNLSISTVYDSQTSLHSDLWWLQWFAWQFLEQYVAFLHLLHVSKLSLRM
jgi:hypothetical protein